MMPACPRHTRPMHLRPLLLSTLWLAATLPAQAQMFKDPQLEGLYRADKLAEVEKLGQQRVASQADDADEPGALARIFGPVLGPVLGPVRGQRSEQPLGQRGDGIGRGHAAPYYTGHRSAPGPRARSGPGSGDEVWVGWMSGPSAGALRALVVQRLTEQRPNRAYVD